MNYSHAENDKILDAWNEFSKKNGEGEIEYDGVAYKGDINTFTGSDGRVYHERKPANEETIWNNSNKRILFVLKELNDPDNPYDSRVVVRSDPENGVYITDTNIKNMLYATKGILESTKNEAASINENEDMNVLMEVWDKAAVAKINVKKQPGGAVADASVIAEHMNTYKDFLKQQLQLLDANIIICCDNREGILATIKDLAYPNAVQLTDEVWWDKDSDTMLIESYHTNPRRSYKFYYDRVINNYVEGLKKINE